MVGSRRGTGIRRAVQHTVSGRLVDPLEIARAALADIRVDPQVLYRDTHEHPADDIRSIYYRGMIRTDVPVMLRALALATLGAGKNDVTPFLCGPCRTQGRDREPCTTAADLIAGRTCINGNKP